MRVLNLGAGVQSTTVYLMANSGEIPAYDYAIFADTGEEPQAVYHHLDWLLSLGGIPILIRSAGKLGEDLIRGHNSTNGRFAAIPAYVDHGLGRREGRWPRQPGGAGCSGCARRSWSQRLQGACHGERQRTVWLTARGA